MFDSSSRAAGADTHHPCAGLKASRSLQGAILLLLAAAPSASIGCACGCGVFDVGTASMFPQHAGTTASVEYDYIDQDRNWSGTSSAPAVDNADKQIRSSVLTAYLAYQFDRSWGLSIAVPYVDRHVRETEEGSTEIESDAHGSLGDIRISAAYTGFAADMSTGVTFGLKLPTGDLELSGVRTGHADRQWQHRPAGRRLSPRKPEQRRPVAVFPGCRVGSAAASQA